jgi:hypothetical protein
MGDVTMHIRRANAVAAALGVLAVSGLSAGTVTGIGAGTAAGAATPPPGTAMFKLSGAVSATLKGQSCDSGATGVVGGQFSFTDTKVKGSKATDWTVDVNVANGKPGTYKDFKPGADGFAQVSVVLQGSTGSEEYNWISKKGVITATKTGGSLKVTVGAYHPPTGVSGKGTVHIVGAWNCPVTPSG